MSDSTLVARPLGALSWVTCASPTYLQQNGTPQALEDLIEHRAIHYFSANARQTGELHFVRQDQSTTVPVKGSIAVNETALYIRLCQDGYGLAQLAEALVVDDLRSGRLVEVCQPGAPTPLTSGSFIPTSAFCLPQFEPSRTGSARYSAGSPRVVREGGRTAIWPTLHSVF
ncbi:LysR substrate-binding domain-containing protein [Achromobacter spanius]|uniref:LysR substrate-binding domain-containing protein n=1 Tax=Achromobacter spanius TaxID=217203 RepID=UPI00381EB5ED